MKNTFFIQSIEEKTTKNGDPYLVVGLLTKEERISAKIWNTSLEGSPVTKGDIVNAQLTTNVYNGQNDYIIKSVSIAEGIKATDVLPSEENIEDMYNSIIELIQETEEPYREILLEIFKDYKEAICRYPASKQNIIIGGYLRHIYNAATMGVSALEVYEHINIEMLIGGILLKEIGIITKYDFSDSDFTLCEKSYLPLSILTCELLNDYARKLGHLEEINVLLETMFSQVTTRENFLIDLILVIDHKLSFI